MFIVIPLRNVDSGEIRTVKLGFSWILFLFSSVFGIPLFWRRFYIGGMFMFLLSLISLKLNVKDLPMIWIFSIPLSFYYGFNGNQLTAKKYLDSGWEFLKPHSPYTKMAKRKWNIVDEPVSTVNIDRRYPVLEAMRHEALNQYSDDKVYTVVEDEQEKTTCFM